MENETVGEMNEGQMCGRCYDEVDELFVANCAEKPELLKGAPIGMYHCPDCGAVVLAGIPHPALCKRCNDRQHPFLDSVNQDDLGKHSQPEGQ